MGCPPCPPAPPPPPLPGDSFSVGEVIRMLAMSVGLVYFCGLVSYDLWTALASKPRVQWIKAKTLVLSALTLQILTLLELKNVSMPDSPNIDELGKLSNNQLAIDSGRLVLCVFIGYMLPGMAGSGADTQWGNIAALNVSVFTAITSELYYVRMTRKVFKKLQFVSSVALAQVSDPCYRMCHQSKPEPPYTYEYYYVSFLKVTVSKERHAWFVGSSVVLLVSTVILILLLISSALAGSTVRDLVTPRIICVIESTKIKRSWVEFEEEILRSWLLAHVGQPQYVISRSVLCSATGVIVTVCIALLAFKAIYMGSMDIVPRHDGWDWLRHTTFSLECLFVLEGWAVVLWRWFCAIFYFPKSAASTTVAVKELTLCQKCSMEDFWTRTIRDLRETYEMHKWRPAPPQKKLENRRKKLLASMTSAAETCKKGKIYFQMHSLLAMQTLLVFFSKFSSRFSEMLCRCFVRRPKDEDSDQEFQKYREALEHVCMPGESAESLWFANEKSFNEVKDSLQEGREEGEEECQDLKALLMERFHSDESDQSNRFVNQLTRFPHVEEYFPFLEENPWKITAVSLLKIIMAVFPFYKDVDSHAETKAVEAYQQAWDAMKFVERSHVQAPDSLYEAEVLEVEVERVSIASDKEFKKLLRLRDSSPSKDNVANARDAIEKLKAEAEEQLEAQKLLSPRDKTHLRDSKDWNVVATSYSMYRVCELVLQMAGSDTNVKALFHELHKFLADVIGSCLLELPEALVKRCRAWAMLYDEENILEAISIAGKIRGVMDEKWTPTLKKLQLYKSKWVPVED